MSFNGINKGQPIYAGVFRAGGSAAAVIGTNGDCYLLPIEVYVRSLFTTTGITAQVASGNIEMAIYDEGFAQLVTTGVQVMGGGGAIMNLGAGITLNPGRYWLAFVTSNATAQIYGGNSTGTSKIMVAAGLPLPAQLSGVVDLGVAVNVPRAMIYQ